MSIRNHDPLHEVSFPPGLIIVIIIISSYVSFQHVSWFVIFHSFTHTHTPRILVLLLQIVGLPAMLLPWKRDKRLWVQEEKISEEKEVIHSCCRKEAKNISSLHVEYTLFAAWFHSTWWYNTSHESLRSIHMKCKSLLKLNTNGKKHLGSVCVKRRRKMMMMMRTHSLCVYVCCPKMPFQRSDYAFLPSKSSQ